MPSPAEPSPIEARTLVDAAERFRRAAPWRRIRDEQVFGLIDPETNELALSVICGGEGLLRGLSLFPGTAGWTTLARMQFETFPEDTDTMLLETRWLSCHFVPRSILGRRDRDLLERAEHRARRASELPQFVSYEPGYASWSVSGAEARLLRMALEQSLVVAAAVREDPDLLLRCHPGEYLVRVRDNTNPEHWTHTYRRPPNTRDIRSPALDELTKARLARLPVSEREWEVDAITGAGHIAEHEGTRPRVLRTLVVLDRETGYMHGADAFEAPDFHQRVVELFIARVLAIGERPRRILVRDHALRELISVVAKALGSKLLRIHYARWLDEAEQSLRSAMGRGRRS